MSQAEKIIYGNDGELIAAKGNLITVYSQKNITIISEKLLKAYPGSTIESEYRKEAVIQLVIS